MSIANKLEELEVDIANAYNKIEEKGGTLPANKNTDNLANAIDSISGGAGLIPREVSSNGVFQVPAENFEFSLPSNVTSVGTTALAYAFWACTSVIKANLGNLTNLSAQSSLHHIFYGCTNLIEVDLSGLETVSGSEALAYAFDTCSNLETIDLSSLISVSGSSSMYSCFHNCDKIKILNLSNLISITGINSMNSFIADSYLLEEIDLSSLETVEGTSAMYSFASTTSSLISVDFSNLELVTGLNVLSRAFYGCTNLTSISFPKLKRIGANSGSLNDYAQFANCFYNVSGITSLSFPELEKIYCTGGNTSSYGTFANNNKIQKMYFPKLNAITYSPDASSSQQNACKYIFYNTAITELHFAAINQSAIEASPGYSTAWGRGAGNVTIYFDL